MCLDNATSWAKFGWYTTPPQSTDQCLWMNLKSLREVIGAEEVDKSLKMYLTIIVDDPAEAYPDVNAVWSKFGNIFGALIPLLSYVPVTKDYLYQGIY
jgi:hypothetical protein